MKKNLIALAVTAAITAPMTAQAAPTIYGKLNQAIESVTDEGIQVTSVASRLGVKGSEDLGNGLQAVYKIEFEVTMSDDAGSAGPGIKNRNQYVGLAGGFGTVFMGRHDTPFKMVQSSDLFNDGHFTDDSRFNGGLGFGGKTGEVRANNVFAYVSPAFGEVKVIVAGADAAADAKDNSTTNIISTGVTYGSAKKGVYGAIGYNTFDKVTGADGSETRLTGQYKENGVIANLSYNTADFKAGGTSGTTITTNLAYKMGHVMPKIKYATIKYKGGNSSNSLGLGMDYELGKSTEMYIDYVSLDKNNAKGVASGDKSTTVLALGLIHKF